MLRRDVIMEFSKVGLSCVRVPASRNGKKEAGTEKEEGEKRFAEKICRPGRFYDAGAGSRVRASGDERLARRG